jgi:iron(III) transport system permease protein
MSKSYKKHSLSELGFGGWGVFSLSLVFSIPLLAVMFHLFLPSTGQWEHLASTVLPNYIFNSIYLMVFVGLGSLLLGTLSAWLVVMYRFPGSAFFSWALILPLAIPAYVMAYATTDFLQFSGPLQTFVREALNLSPQQWKLPNIRSLGGVAIVFSLVLYPYVYLIARAAFLKQSTGIVEAARTLGCGATRLFLKVAVPAARPALVAGVALVLMETLADYGAVSFFGVPTFTTGIYRAWFSFGDKVAAAQLATMLLGFVVLLLALERISRGKSRYENNSNKQDGAEKIQLTGKKAWGASLFCALPVGLGFILPVLVLISMALRVENGFFTTRYFDLILNTVTLGGITALLATLLGLMVVFALRMHPAHKPLAMAGRLSGLGYAIPGSIIAVGVLIPFAWFDNQLDGFFRTNFGLSTGLILTGSIAALVFAYLVRFLSVSMQTLEAGFAKVNPSIDSAARSLGANKKRLLKEVHFPLLKVSLLTAFLMVFVDVMKELPATLIMRPFNFDTLAVVAHNFASDERLAEAAVPALTIVLVGLLPVLLLSRMISSSTKIKKT